MKIIQGSNSLGVTHRPWTGNLKPQIHHFIFPISLVHWDIIYQPYHTSNFPTIFYDCEYLITFYGSLIKGVYRASLVEQCLRICLPMHGTRVWALVQEDPTCCGATKPVHHNYWACALEPVSHNYWARMPQLLKPKRLDAVFCNKRSHRNEKPMHRNKE